MAQSETFVQHQPKCILDSDGDQTGCSLFLLILSSNTSGFGSDNYEAMNVTTHLRQLLRFQIPEKM